MKKPTTRTAASSATTDDTGADELPIHRMPGHYVRRLQQVAVALFAQEIPATLDITPVQFAALQAIRHQPDLDQATLAGLIGYDRATIGGVVDRLEAKGWVTRSLDANDRRVRLLRLTGDGTKALRAVMPAVERVQKRLMEPLTAAERDAFEQLALKLLAHHL